MPFLCLFLRDRGRRSSTTSPPRHVVATILPAVPFFLRAFPDSAEPFGQKGVILEACREPQQNIVQLLNVCLSQDYNGGCNFRVETNEK